MLVRNLFGVALLSAVLASDTFAQFTPLVGKIRQTDETLSAGKIIKTVEREAAYSRSSDGSYVLHWTSMSKDGETQPLFTGGFWDNKTGTSYRLDYQNKRATVDSKDRPPMRPDAADSSEKTLPQDSVHGILCTVAPAQMRLPSGQIATVGKVCSSTEHHLILRQELNYPTSNGQSVHMLMEMYDVQLGVEPDPKVFDVKNAFTVYEPSARKE
jgi:hypothetical protein